MLDRRIDAQRREALVRQVKRHATNAALFDPYQRLCEKLPTLLRAHGLRLTLDYLRMLARAGPYQQAADALLRDWAATADGVLSFAGLAQSHGAQAVAPAAAEGLLLLALALVDVEALRHACKLVHSDHAAGQIPSAPAMGVQQPLALNLRAPAALQHQHCQHPGLAWRFCGEVGTQADDATWRHRQITTVLRLTRQQWQPTKQLALTDPHRAWYTASYQRHVAWLQSLPASRQTQCMALRLRSPLFTALGERGVWDAQVLLHPVSGMPFVAASQIKNLVRRAFAERAQRLAKPESQAALHALLDDLLGDAADGAAGDAAGDGHGGLLVVHDAWWVPETGDGPLAGDIDNHHHTAYLQRRALRALPQDSPQPHPQLAVQGQLLFALGIHPAAGPAGGDIVRRCMRWLAHALAERGIGGRSAAVGAGRFEPAALE